MLKNSIRTVVSKYACNNYACMYVLLAFHSYFIIIGKLYTFSI